MTDADSAKATPEYLVGVEVNPCMLAASDALEDLSDGRSV